MTEIPETIYSRARTALAYAQTAASSGEPEKAIEIIAREMMQERVRCLEIAFRHASIASEDKIRLGMGGGNILSAFAEERRSQAQKIADEIFEGDT